MEIQLSLPFEKPKPKNLFLKPDRILQYGYVVYFIYNYWSRLRDEGYKIVRNTAPSVFTFCVVCERYQHFRLISKGFTHNEQYMCEICSNVSTPHQIVK